MKSSGTTQSGSTVPHPLRRGTARSAPSAAPTGKTKPSAASPSKSSQAGSPGIATTSAARCTGESSPTLSLQHATALEARGLDPELCARLGFHTVKGKFSGKDGLAVPFVRESKTLKRKYFGPRQGRNKLIMQDEDRPHAFWNEDVLRDESIAHLPVVITEGEFDGVAGVQAAGDIVRVVSVDSGANSNLDFFESIWPLLVSVPRFILAGDGDAAGQKLNQELARRLGAARCAWLDYAAFCNGCEKPCKDLNDVLLNHGQQAARKMLEHARPYPIKGLYKLSDFPELNLEVRDTGWPNLNSYLKLWVPELFVLTGIPQHGKSKFLLHMLMQQVEQHQSRAALFTPEVPIKPHVRAEMRRFHGGEHEVADAWIDENFVFLHCDPADPEESASVDWLIEKAQDAVIRYGIDWFAIDPWNQVTHNRGKDSSAEYQEKSLKQLNTFRTSFQCGVAISAHPTKGVLNTQTGKIRVPTLYDIDGSAHWYNAPDHGVVVDRPNSAGIDIRVLVKKSRFMQSGVCGEAWLRYEAEQGRYIPLVNPPEADQ